VLVVAELFDAEMAVAEDSMLWWAAAFWAPRLVAAAAVAGDTLQLKKEFKIKMKNFLG
jgi:hypothetical protein